MDTKKLLYCVLYYFLLSLPSGQQVVQGHIAPHHHHHHSHRHHLFKSGGLSKLFVFGDSYADTGNTNKSTSPWKDPYGITFPGKPAGRFSDGRVLTDYVAKSMGIRSPIPYRWRELGIPLLIYGMNFAYGGTGVFPTLNPGPNMTTQIDFFQNLITDNVFNISDLHSSLTLVTLAGNDYLAYIVNNVTQGVTSFVPKVVTQLTVNLKRIHRLGAKKIAVTALPPSGCLPRSTATSSFQQCNETANSLANYHNLLLKQAVAKLNNETNDSAFVIVDLYASFVSVIQNKGEKEGSIKFENPLKPCCFEISSNYTCGSVDESGAKKYTLCEDKESAFFWDSVHPTQEGWLAVYAALQATLEQLF